jgi:hypothetical protein
MQQSAAPEKERTIGATEHQAAGRRRQQRRHRRVGLQRMAQLGVRRLHLWRLAFELAGGVRPYAQSRAQPLVGRHEHPAARRVRAGRCRGPVCGSGREWVCVKLEIEGAAPDFHRARRRWPTVSVVHEMKPQGPGQRGKA